VSAGIAKIREWSQSQRDDLAREIERLRPWYYSFDFGNGLTTGQGQNPHGKFEKVLKWVPADLDGASCLDCPSNNAQLAMLLKDRGAGRVVARDNDMVAVRQAEFLVNVLGYAIDVGHCGIHDLSSDPSCTEAFDYVFCLGLLYHLTDMFGALKQCATLTRKACFIETAVLRIDEHNPDTALFIEGRYGSDITNWWIPGVRCVIAMARAAGFKTVECIDYWNHKHPVTREGYRMQARAIFCATKGGPLTAPRLVRSV
jgi:tRNA (mo5U34)-methyltransferase